MNPPTPQAGSQTEDPLGRFLTFAISTIAFTTFLGVKNCANCFFPVVLFKKSSNNLLLKAGSILSSRPFSLKAFNTSKNNSS